jgi:hypothetical protein
MSLPSLLGLIFAPDLVGLMPVVDELLRELYEVVGRVVGVLVQKVHPVVLAIADRYIVDEQFELAFTLTKLDGMPLVFLAFWFHIEILLVS